MRREMSASSEQRKYSWNEEAKQIFAPIGHYLTRLNTEIPKGEFPYLGGV